jgi:hypothetical protein
MNRSTLIRRLAGIFFLGLAVVLLVLGETVFAGRLRPFATLLYWSVCLLATLAAVGCALLDALDSLTRSRRERRALLEETLHQVDVGRAQRRKGPPDSR